MISTRHLQKTRITNIAIVVSVTTTIPADECPIQLRDVTAQSGIVFKHTHGGNGQRFIVETVAGGLALFDYDDDGYIDIYFLNGAPLKGTADAATRAITDRDCTSA